MRILRTVNPQLQLSYPFGFLSSSACITDEKDRRNYFERSVVFFTRNSLFKISTLALLCKFLKVAYILQCDDLNLLIYFNIVT